MTKIVTFGLALYTNSKTRERYSIECIESVLKQDNPNWELIISDDNSPIKIDLSRFKDPRIKFFRQDKNLKVFGNFNFCLEKAAGDYFLPLGDDDLAAPDFVSTALEIFDKYDDIDILYFDFDRINDKSQIFEKRIYSAPEGKILKSGRNLDSMTKSHLNTPVNFYSLIKTDILKKLGRYPEQYGNVADIYMRYLFGAKINGYYIKKALIRNRIHLYNEGGVKNAFELSEQNKFLLPNLLKDFGDLLNDESKEILELQIQELNRGYLQLTKTFSESGRTAGINFFFKYLKYNIKSYRNYFIFINGLIFGKSVYKVFIWTSKKLIRLRGLIGKMKYNR